jgi:diketogulonate reductase-like aldo/keto reductase
MRDPLRSRSLGSLRRNRGSLSIPGTTQLERLEENIGAVAIELTPDDLRELDDATAKITVQGARYPEELERMTYR